MKLHPQNPTPGTDNPTTPKAGVTYIKVSTKPGQPSIYSCLAPNGVLLGSFEQEVDGFYYFFPVLRGGFWEAYILHDIARKLDALNEAWSQKLDEYFKERS